MAKKNSVSKSKRDHEQLLQREKDIQMKLQKKALKRQVSGFEKPVVKKKNKRRKMGKQTHVVKKSSLKSQKMEI
eukprot:CAMPEP_0113936190 /NCGR_PEP_ID=MMETSP1339-20121228/3159_1 /TAXON_ID=94617 /ORGANISM="Fibrocapsa japonica" /LENGTH=73 /DNA_ID=CAMNT_0000938571 /DNA_START=33 /DNA_END=254 /DNA_ORIENTATION=- /assembly_acc=CAM_ASM_000762